LVWEKKSSDADVDRDRERSVGDLENQEMLLFFVHLLKNVELESLRFWWKKIVKRDQEELLKRLRVATIVFEYMGLGALGFGFCCCHVYIKGDGFVVDLGFLRRAQLKGTADAKRQVTDSPAMAVRPSDRRQDRDIKSAVRANGDRFHFILFMFYFVGVKHGAFAVSLSFNRNF
jgi:hypothetical protein